MVEVLGGNPLSLKLASHLISTQNYAVLGDPRTLRALKVEAAQARLYSRILSHIDDTDVQKLAVPGLVVRLIDRDVIRLVLAEPCGLGNVDDARATDLLEKLVLEVTLVEQVSNGVYRHRADIRRVMLAGMPGEMRDQVAQIHRNAVSYWGNQSGGQARGEELYHMLQLGMDRAVLEKRWSDKMAAELESSLSGALEELPPASPARIWLAEKLGATLSESERATIAMDAQERQTEHAATQFLAHGDASQALAVLDKQKPFAPGSRLFGLLARVLFRIGRLDDALAMTEKGIESVCRDGQRCGSHRSSAIAAYLFESLGLENEAIQELARARSQETSRLAQLRIQVRRGRILRKLNQDDPTIRTEIRGLAESLERDILQHSAALREAAAEIGDANPTLLGQALERFGPEILDGMTPEALEQMLVSNDIYSKTEIATFAGISGMKLSELVRSNLDQMIHGTDDRSRKACQWFVDALRQSVNDVLKRNYSTESSPTSASQSAALLAAGLPPRITLTGDAKKKLADVLARALPLEPLRRVAQFNLDLDLEHLGGNLTQFELTSRMIDTAESYGLLDRLFEGVLANVNPHAAARITDILKTVQSPKQTDLITQTEKRKGPIMPPRTPSSGLSGIMSHYKRIAAGRASSSGGFETVAPLESVQDRVESTEDTLKRIVKDYLGNDPHLLEVAKKIVSQGGEALRILDQNDEDALRRRPELLSGLEAIVRTDGSRPSFLIREGDVDRKSSPLGSWEGLLDRSAERIRGAIGCVGRIDIPGSNAGFMGTGFLIQENLIITNRHVLQVSARFMNGTWKFSDGAAIDFGHEFRARDSINRRELKRVLFCGSRNIDFSTIDHSKLDLALIELEPSTPESRPHMVLSLQLAPGWAVPGQTILIVGYPGSPPTMLYPPTLVEQLFHTTFGYKRIAPGELIASQMGVQPWTLTHDATTLGGNSGSIVLLADQEQMAAGLHYGGRGVEPRENWGHVLASVLNATDGMSPKMLHDILRENGVKLLDGASSLAGPSTPVSQGHAPVAQVVEAQGSTSDTAPPSPGRSRPVSRSRLRCR